MNPKVNLKAKIERHSRILKDSNLSNNSKNNNPFSFKIVLVLIVFVLPFYPALASLVYKNTVTDFDRGDIDESTILSSSYESKIEDNQKEGDGKTIIKSEDGNFLSVNTIGDLDRDLEGTNEIITYEVKPGESIASIALKFNITENSIYRANNFNHGKVIHPGNKIKIPPVSGLIYKIKKGDTIESIAKKYGIDKKLILKQNLLENTSSTIVAGKDLMIPGAKPIIPVVEKPKPKKVLVHNTSKSKKSGYSFASNSKSQYVADTGEYKLIKRTPKRRFAWGNCTRFVAQYKNVTWGGNANAWLRNAKSAGVPTGSAPRVGSIIVFSGRGYNPRYGHVGIVTSVGNSHLIIKDMNYRRLNEVTTRKISRNHGSIIGYIYAN